MSQHPRWTLFAAIGALIAGVVIIYILASLNAEVAVLDERSRNLEQAYAATRAPDDPLPEEIASGVEPPPPGERGEPGLSGEDGRDGRPGRDGIDGLTPVCFFTPTVCIGMPGADGQDSMIPGPPGSPGQDSTAPGPQGFPGAAGTDGQDSTVPGPIGPAGVPGPGPASFSFEWANQTFTCTDPDADRNYSCESAGGTP